MASLQRRAFPPLSLPWRRCDVAAEEVVRDRRAAIESGLLKGCRRLFDAYADEMCCSLSDQKRIGSSGSEAAEEGRWTVSEHADKYYIIDHGQGDCSSPSAATSSSSSTSAHVKFVVLMDEHRIEPLTLLEATSDDHPGDDREKGGLRLGSRINKREFPLALIWPVVLVIACLMATCWRSGKPQAIPQPT